METRGWSSFVALRAHVRTRTGEKDAMEKVVVEGQLMHQRRISRKCSFFDLASADENERNERVEVILKFVDNELSVDEVDVLRRRATLGDVVQIHGFLERLAPSGEEEMGLLVHARDIVVITPWKEAHPGVSFVPVPTAHTPKATNRGSDASSSVPERRQHCKFWINTKSCQSGDRCELYHATADEMREARAAWLEERLQLKRERAQQDEDPQDPHGKIGKHQRAAVFVDWLVETFGKEFLSNGDGVIDVAGGRGNVSFELWNKRGIRSTLIDPRPMKLSRMQHKHFKKLKINQDDIPAALVPQKLALFNTTSFVEDPANEQLLQNASMLVGMHPDEATDEIVDVAVQYNKPFAIVPCCVFGHKFPERRVPQTDSKVVSYEDLVAYLQAKDARIQKAFLPFDGKNLVLFRPPASVVEASASKP
ncbi:hypothetical protein Poli38472_008576 [Pythium oligandrum]|uniref:C3H1-type domain-containing protein n=1 Tax=Pythium oligandrum TaxID=41045 RepID=A0A8K1C401_PYTOL|nr:hypothetical protein Poli38472_008576 [Pythium oligandrum]|eukprot:TMW55928.1 hypothetical protein Poli38472_008576 [Pythium oligandrum]